MNKNNLDKITDRSKFSDNYGNNELDKDLLELLDSLNPLNDLLPYDYLCKINYYTS
jgi:hypothetical protein